MVSLTFARLLFLTKNNNLIYLAIRGCYIPVSFHIQSLSYLKIGRLLGLSNHHFDKPDLRRLSDKTTYFSGNVTSPARYFSDKTTYGISQVTLPALQRISQAEQLISEVTLPAVTAYALMSRSQILALL